MMSGSKARKGFVKGPGDIHTAECLQDFYKGVFYLKTIFSIEYSAWKKEDGRMHIVLHEPEIPGNTVRNAGRPKVRRASGPAATVIPEIPVISALNADWPGKKGRSPEQKCL